MVEGNFSTLTPTTEDVQRRYMKYILWWYGITPPSYPRQIRYGVNTIVAGNLSDADGVLAAGHQL